MKTKIVLFGILTFAFSLFGAVGDRMSPVVFVTNQATVYLGSNAPGVLIWTNGFNITNAPVRIQASGSLTNHGPTSLSNTTINGELMLRPVYAALTDITNNNYSVSNTSQLFIISTTNIGMIFTGFSGGYDGKKLSVVNLTGTNMGFFATNSASSVSNRLDLVGFDTNTTTGKGVFNFIWNSQNTNWVVESWTP